MRIKLSLTPKQVAEIINALDIAYSDYTGRGSAKERKAILSALHAVSRQVNKRPKQKKTKRAEWEGP